MNPAIQKTLTLVLLIFIGYCLKSKITSKEQRKGIKTLILSVALPAMIFVALLKVQIDLSLLYLPIGILAINVLFFFVAKWTVGWFGIEKNSTEARTWQMLMPSFAPGLSCFPFLIEYIGEESLALAALTDVGNKVFVLVILYLIAMRWHRQTQQKMGTSSKDRLKNLLVTMVKEPVNAVIVAAILLLSFGYNMTTLPAFLQDGIGRMSLMMTPLVLIFIGMAVRVDWQQLKQIGSLLLFRSACAFFVSGLLLIALPVDTTLAIVIVVFLQSAASFWPFAHISLVNDAEGESATTFQPSLALNILALSLPLSTILILGICSVPTLFIDPIHLLFIAALFLAVAFLPRLFVMAKSVQKRRVINWSEK